MFPNIHLFWDYCILWSNQLIEELPKAHKTSFSLWQEDPWCHFSQLYKHNNSKFLLFHYLVWLQFIWPHYSHINFEQVSNLAILDLGRWSYCQRPSWEEKEYRLTQPWHSWCNICWWWSTQIEHTSVVVKVWGWKFSALDSCWEALWPLSVR